MVTKFSACDPNQLRR